jgi:hypothetical protein
VMSLSKMPMLFVSAQSRACLRAAGMENWRCLPLPGLYRADFGAQYAHHLHEVLLCG